jgi:hypothetical protein
MSMADMNKNKPLKTRQPTKLSAQQVNVGENRTKNIPTNVIVETIKSPTCDTVLSDFTAVFIVLHFS